MNDNTPTPTWGALSCYLIDHCEGETITEENLQCWVAKMLKNPNYTNIVDPNENIEHDVNNLVYTPCNVIKG